MANKRSEDTDIIPFRQIPGGGFMFRGSSRQDIHKELPLFYMKEHLVTNEEYHRFVCETGYPVPSNWDQETRIYPAGRGRHPVTNISRRDAEAFCSWYSDKYGGYYCLPSEEEWEKAGRGGIYGLRFPWPEQAFDPAKCNSAESRIGDTTPVGQYKMGRSLFGCYDMVGNVSEWTRDTENGMAVVRGSSYETTAARSDCYFRLLISPNYVSDFIGFRVVRKSVSS